MLLTIKEVASRLKISISLAYGLVARGDLPSYRIGRSCRRVAEDDLLKYLETCRQEHFRIVKAKGRHF